MGRNLAQRCQNRTQRLALGILLAFAGSSAADAQIFLDATDLEFGTIAVGQTSGSVQITPSGNANCGPHTCMGGQSAADFTISGNGTYSITLSTGDQLDRVGGGDSAALENLTPSSGSVSTDLLGFASFQVGGDLVLGPSALDGEYTGTYEVTLENQ